MTENNQELLHLARMWGFREDQTLLDLHTQIVAAIRAGDHTRELWQQYVKASKSQMTHPGSPSAELKARAAREICLGRIFLEADETVAGLCCLIRAKAAAGEHDWCEEEAMLMAEINRLGTPAEYAHARALFLERARDPSASAERYREALSLYGQEGADYFAPERALLNRNIAECYLGLIRLRSGDIRQAQDRAVSLLQSAVANSQGTRHFPRMQALLHRTGAEPWWTDAVRRQEA